MIKSDRLKDFLSWLRGMPIRVDLGRYRARLQAILRQERSLQDRSQEELAALAQNIRKRLTHSGTLDGLLVETFALVREAARRGLGLNAHEEQLVAGIAIHEGRIAEMQTGEGKTLAAVFPAVLHAMTGEAVHILTVNDYLARRDAEWMGPVYRQMGLSVGFVEEDAPSERRRKAWHQDVTYTTARQAGFDWLRDDMCHDPAELLLPTLAMALAVIDEVDSILVDEARIPLVIAGEMDDRRPLAHRMAEVARHLDPIRDYSTDEHARNVYFTDSGFDRVQEMLRCSDLHDPHNLPLLAGIQAALHAEVLLTLDVDYIVRGGRIELVDEFTGRIADDRRWPDGLQAALEAKEGVGIQDEGQILGSITLQHFIGQYGKVAGMTATAQAAAKELVEFYDTPTAVIPSHKPCIRIDQPDFVFTHREAKERAVIDEIQAEHSRGRPVLVGTHSVEESERLAARLVEAGLKVNVLNARQNEEEARIVARVGALGAVTVATNMAGRGTDIRLGGPDEADRDEVARLGGLYVLGTNRHQSRRVDDQLRGRAARQGDPGESRFFLSLEDDLLRRFGVAALLPPLLRELRQDEPLDEPRAQRFVEGAQRIIESQNLEIRRTLVQYTQILEEHRQLIMVRRRRVLLGDEPPVFARMLPERHRDLARVVPAAVLDEVERTVTLVHIDRAWSEHLAWVADTRSGVHLIAAGGGRPLDEFHRRAVDAFRSLQTSIQESIAHTLATANITERGIDLESAGLKVPSSTWTYLINDNAQEGMLDRLAGQVARLMKKAVGSGG